MEVGKRKGGGRQEEEGIRGRMEVDKRRRKGGGRQEEGKNGGR